jgi:hypothetical protein
MPPLKKTQFLTKKLGDMSRTHITKVAVDCCICGPMRGDQQEEVWGYSWNQDDVSRLNQHYREVSLMAWQRQEAGQGLGFKMDLKLSQIAGRCANSHDCGTRVFLLYTRGLEMTQSCRSSISRGLCSVKTKQITSTLDVTRKMTTREKRLLA